MRKSAGAALLAGAVLLAVSSCSSTDQDQDSPPPPQMAITGVSVLKMSGDDPAWVTASITSDSDDTLTAARVDGDKGFELAMSDPAPQTQPTAGEEPAAPEVGTVVDSIPMTAGTQLDFGPGNYGLTTLEGPKLKKGETVDIMFDFDQAQDLTVTATVVAY